MCGIAGIVHFDQRPVQPHELEAVNQQLAHRGPDGQGQFIHRHAGIAHRRLAILDPKAGIQPFLTDDKEIALTFNGEVYNFVELREQLKHRHKFTTGSDTEVILRAYEEWGIDAIRRFQGMFALGILDLRKQKLYLVRDRLGIKPLYYYQSKRLAFASELAALLELEWVQRDINPEGVKGFLRYQYVPTPHSIYRNCHKLEPAHYLEIDINEGTVSKQRYWHLEVKEKHQSEDAWREELTAKLHEIHTRYVRSDVPCGSFLSGGVDSSVVTAFMAKHVPIPPMSFSCGFNEEKYSEIPFAEEAAGYAGSEQHSHVVSVMAASDIIRKLTRHFGEPFGDSSAVPTYYVSKTAAEKVKVVLSGDGGDEMFGGYTAYKIFFEHLKRPEHLGFVQKYYLKAIKRLGWKKENRDWAYLHELGPYRLYKQYRRIFPEQHVRDLMHADHKSFSEFETECEIGPFMAGGLDMITASQANDVTSYMLDDILTKVDRMSMACSLEVRVPLLDHTVAELAFSMPLSMRIRRESGRRSPIIPKYLLKKVAEQYFPKPLVHRPKMGFGIPVGEWCKGGLREMIEDGLRNSQADIYNYLDYQATQDVLDRFFDHEGLVAPSQIWCLMMLSLWFQEVHLRLPKAVDQTRLSA